MDLQLTDKVALVAGSSAGLGLATAKRLVAEGAKVIICGRSENRLNKAKNDLLAIGADPAAIGTYVVDLTMQAEIKPLVDFSIEQFGQLDILITNAGGPPVGQFTTLAEADWHKACQLTLMSAKWLIDVALPHLRQVQDASILTITSLTAKQPFGELLLSNVFRPAVIGLTKSLSQQLGPENIRVNSILPGYTETDRSRGLLKSRAERNKTSYETEVKKVCQDISLNRIGQPEEFANVAAFLVSKAASYVTGVMIQVDGGRYPGLL